MRPDFGYPQGVIRPARPVPRPLSGLAELLGVGRAESVADGPGRLTGVTHDSRAVQPGDLYAALPGARTHGAMHAEQAVAAGAVAILTDPDGRDLAARAGVPVFVVSNPRDRLGDVSCWIYGDPSTRMTMIGVTGTSGKTTSQLPVRGRPARRRAQHRPDRRGGDQARRRPGRLRADHAGGAGPAGAARGGGRARGDGGRDGGVEPLARARPGGGHPLRRGRVHQPVPGPPGLPRRVRGLLPGQGEAVHPGLLGRRGGERGRPVRQAAGGRGVDPDRHVLRRPRLRRLPAGGLAGRRRALRRRRVHVPDTRAGRGRGRRVGHAARFLQRRQRPRRDRGPGRGRR